MKKINKIIILSFLITNIFVFSACEKVIDINLGDTKEKIVVEAIVSDIPNYSYVKLSKNNGFYDNSNFIKLTNAKVTISDDKGNSFEFNESDSGYYSNPTFIGTQETEYELKIDVDGKIFTSKSRMPFNTKIDSTNTFMVPSQFSGKLMTIANLYYTDSSYVGNYYRIKVFVNNAPIQASTFNLYSDGYVNGTMSAFSYNSEDLVIGDSVIFYLLNTDQSNYEYFRLLYLNPGMSFSSAPGNPNTNIDGEDVIGFFGAYSISSDTLVIMPPVF